ncbi:MAG: CDP-glycerol glycerophosphotransferase family protein [Gemmatimonadetes bacterium]|nr:CDP-glycerol glycerophosphotransferase family protein [Gemmatimonadota bacterium]
MKFDRTSPLVWAYFLVTAANIVIASVVAAVLRRPDGPRRGVLSGHLYNGNLRVFYDTVGADATDWAFRYIYIDHGAYRAARPNHPEALSSVRIDHMIWMARADVVMTDHLPGIWALLEILRPGIAFVDVWHGIGFKPFGPELGSKTARYRALFVASEWDARESYVADGGASPDQTVVTGYARTDPLVSPADHTAITQRYDLPEGRDGVLLVAPTWNHGDQDREILIFGLDPDDFLRRLDRWAAATNWTVLFRSHLNSKFATADTFTNVGFLPLADYPLTYELLLVSDVVVTDWSSIAFDYLVLGRPIVFMDIPPPFPATRFTEAERVGYLAGDWDGLAAALDTATRDPDDFAAAFGEQRRVVLEKAFGDTLDGRSAARYLEALDRIVDRERA